MRKILKTSKSFWGYHLEIILWEKIIILNATKLISAHVSSYKRTFKYRIIKWVLRRKHLNPNVLMKYSNKGILTLEYSVVSNPILWHLWTQSILSTLAHITELIVWSAWLSKVIKLHIYHHISERSTTLWLHSWNVHI